MSKERILKQNADKYFFGDRPTKDFFEAFKRKTEPKSKVIFVSSVAFILSTSCII